MLLVGCKKDLRYNHSVIEWLARENQSPLSYEQVCSPQTHFHPDGYFLYVGRSLFLFYVFPFFLLSGHLSNPLIPSIGSSCR